MEIRVWAPNAATLALAIAAARLTMARGDGGWWSIYTPLAVSGADYAFVIDGAEPPLPDPRSAFQPHGVHDPSRIVDHSAFRWTDGGWNAPPLDRAVIYELHIGAFTPAGTFAAAIARLDHLVALGVTHVELMPVAEFSGDRGWGYDGVDLFAPHHAYGGPDGLKSLIDACHARGLAVLIDVVYNHLGPSGNYLPRFGPYLTGRYTTPWGDAINFDGRGSDEVRRFFCDNAIAWLRDYHADGLRIDAVHAILDTSAIHFLEQLASEVDALENSTGRRLALIAESDLNDPRIVRPTDIGGYGIDAQWSDDFHHALHAVLTGERAGYYEDFGTLADLAKALRSAWVYDGRHSRHRGRRHGRPPSGLDGAKFLGYLQTHDQVGNRARGDRASHLMSLGRAKVGATLALTAPFIPMLFMGEEWAASSPFQYFAGHPEPELARAVSEGRRREFAAFGWKPEEVPDPEAEATFIRSKLDWSELDREPHREMLEWYRALIKLRAATPELRDGRLDRVDVSFDEAARWLVVSRGPIAIVCNLAPAAQSVPLPFAGRLILASEPGVTVVDRSLVLPGDSVVIIRCN